LNPILRLGDKAEAPERASDEEQRIELLRQIAKAGGAIAPQANPLAERGYEYQALDSDVDRDLQFLAERGYLEARFYDRVSLCPRCSSHHLNIREICPGCRSSHLTGEGLLHHFRCGYVGIPSEFSPRDDGSYVCPKCNRTMYHLGTEYDRLGKAFVCRGCARISDNPPVEAVCLACGQRTPADDLVSAEVFRYVLTSRGADAIHRGSLRNADDDKPASLADAPVYRRAILLEFLNHELKRLEYFRSGFSVLMVEYAAGKFDQRYEWLKRLNGCLREIDRIGQLADSLYVVVLPQTKKSKAEALRKSITAQLGPESPLLLTAIEIAEQGQLAAILARKQE
jgi:hypothetical protein